MECASRCTKIMKRMLPHNHSLKADVPDGPRL